MDDQEYLRLFNIKPQSENINETNREWVNLNKLNNEQWQSLNETPNTQQYNINENLNEGWNTADFVVETRINGQQQNKSYPEFNPYGIPPRKRQSGANLNGLDQYSDDDNINEIYRQPIAQQPQVIQPPQVQNLEDADVVSIEMFENMNSNAMISLARKKFDNLDASKVTTTVQETQVRFLNS
jgi:hypothetical protein